MVEEEAGHTQVQGPGDPGILGLVTGDTELEAVLDIRYVHVEAVGDILGIQADEDIQVEGAEDIQQAEEGLLLGV